MSVILLPEPGGVADGRIVYFSCAPNVREESLVEVTAHPVEQGTDVSDHARTVPSVLEFDAFVTNTPIDIDYIEGRGAFKNVELEIPSYPLSPSLNNLAALAVGAIGNLFSPPDNSARVLTFDRVFDGPREVFDIMQELQASKTPCRAITRMRTLPLVLVAACTPTATAEDGTGRSFSVMLKAIRTAKTKSVSTPVPSEPRGAGAKAGGKSSGKAAGKKSAEQKKSLAYSFLHPE